MNRWCWIILVGLAGGCFGIDPAEVPLGEEFELTPNQSTRVIGSDLTVAFRRVVGDTRCPIDVVCVVEGKAGIELELFGAATRGPVLIQSSLPATWTDDRYSITIVDLRPHTSTSRPIKPEEYQLRLVVNLVVPQ